MDFFISNAYASAEGGQQGGYSMMIALVVIMFVFYFITIHPQKKREKQHSAMLAALAIGDEVVTAGGILGEIKDLDDVFATIEVAAGVCIKVQRRSISSVMPKGTVEAA